MAGELKACIRIFYDSGYYQINVEATMDKGGKPTKMFTKDFRETEVTWAKNTVADFKRKVGSKILQTKNGGFFLGTLAKKPLQDSDLLEAIGVQPDKKFTKTFDLSFEYDPDLDPARYHTSSNPAPTPSTSSAPAAAKTAEKALPSTAEPHGNQLVMEITVENSDGKYRVHVKGVSPHYNPQTDLTFGPEFESLRMGEFLEKLGTTNWPPLERQGFFLGKEREAFTNRSKLDIVGITCRPGKTETYKCLFDIDVSAKAPEKSAAPASSSGATTSTSAGGPPVKTGQLLLELQVTKSGGQINVNAHGSADHFKKDSTFSVKSSEWDSLTVDQLLGKLGSGWPSFQFGGFLWSSSGKKSFLGDDSLSSVGLQGTTTKSTYQLILDVDAMPSSGSSSSHSSSSSSTSSSHAPAQIKLPALKPVEWKGPAHLTVELRVFEDSGYQFVTIKSEESHFKAEQEFSVKNEEYKSMNMDTLLGKLSHKWPVFKAGGVAITPAGKHPFSASHKVVSDVKLLSDPVKTLSYQIVLEVDPNAEPRRQPSPRGAIAAATATMNANKKPESTATAETGFISEDELGMSIRLFTDSGFQNVTIIGKAKEFSQRIEFAVSAKDWNTFTWGQLKEKLNKFPGTHDGGEVLGENKKKFTNRDTLNASGLKGSDARPVTYQCMLKLNGQPSAYSQSHPAQPPTITTTTSSSSASTSSTHSSSTSKPTSSAHTRVTSGSSTAAQTLDLINVELRLFINSGLYEFQVQATGAHKASLEISLSKDKFEAYTLENLKKRFGAKWPPLKPGCMLSKHPGQVHVNDSDKLKDVGVDVHEELVTKSFDLAFTVDK